MTTDAAIISPGHPNAVSYRRAADAFRAGDLDTLATHHPRGRDLAPARNIVDGQGLRGPSHAT
jgi:hypothetical protein